VTFTGPGAGQPGGNLFGQSPWARRGESDGQVRSLGTRLTTAEAALATINLGAWTVHTPTLSQPGAITKTVNYSSYIRVGRLIVWSFDISVTGTGTAANRILLSYPVQPAGATVALQPGAGTLYDASAGTEYIGVWENFFSVTASLGFRAQVGDLWGVLPNLALGAGDHLAGTVMFEASS